MSPETKDELIAAIPNLRAFAISLTGQVDRADDLVQETLVKAWTNIESYQEGTNMRAWLFTILRNAFYSEFRKRRREVQDVDNVYSSNLAVHAGQDSSMDVRDFESALGKLSDDQREALILIGASGFSYEEAAGIIGCEIGTVKSRVNRARRRLADLLEVSGADDFTPDKHQQAVLSSRSNLVHS